MESRPLSILVHVLSMFISWSESTFRLLHQIFQCDWILPWEKITWSSQARTTRACSDICGKTSAVLGVIILLKVSFSCTMYVALSVKQIIIQSTTACQAVHAVPIVLALHCRSILKDGTEIYAVVGAFFCLNLKISWISRFELAGPGWRWLDLVWLAAPAAPPAQPFQLSRTGCK